MSMNEIESLVEGSVYLLDEVGGSSPDVRALYANLYSFCDRHDTKFTRFRNMDLLLKHRFVYRVPLEKHPRYQEHEKVLKKLSADSAKEMVWLDNADGALATKEYEGFGYSYLSPSYDHEKKIEVYMYVEVGSPTWHELVHAKFLKGKDAEEPKKISPLELATIMAAKAVTKGKGELAAAWYGVIGAHEIAEMSFSAIKRNKTIQNLRKLAKPHAKVLEGLKEYILDSGADDEVIEWWLNIMPPAESGLSQTQALSVFQNPPQELHECLLPNSGSYIQKAFFKDALLALQQAEKPPLPELVELLHDKSPWVSLFAAQVLAKQASVFHKDKRAGELLTRVLEALDREDEKRLLYSDENDQNARIHLSQLVANGGAKCVDQVLAHAKKKLEAKTPLDPEWYIALIAAGKVSNKYWSSLLSLQTDFAKRFGSKVSSLYLYDCLALTLLTGNERLPVRSSELAELVEAEMNAVCDLMLKEDPFSGRIRFLLSQLWTEHERSALKLQDLWIQKFIDWIESAARSPKKFKNELEGIRSFIAPHPKGILQRFLRDLKLDAKTGKRAEEAMSRLESVLRSEKAAGSGD